MENMKVSTIKHPNQTEESNHPNSINSSKTSTPVRLQVPKDFKYPERYRSPTDLMVSPVTKGILARTRKISSLLPPSKVQDVAPDVVSFNIET